MRKIVKKSLPKQIAETIEEMIARGEFKVGCKIPTEPELIEYFGVSRNTVREAIQSLTHMGLLESRQGDGTYVVAAERLQVDFYNIMHKTKYEDVIEVRNLLEKHIVVSAIRNHTDSDIMEIKRLLFLRKNQEQSIHENTQADMNFHISIAKATHNEILVSIYKYVSEFHSEFIYEMLKHHEIDQKYVDHVHDLLYTAIRDKDVELAQRCVDEINGINES